jgi:L-aspartate oxidase
MYDYIIIGSGIAGLFTALSASKHGSVLLLTKSALEESNTRYAQGGIAAAVSPDDSPRLHYEDTMAAGAGLCDERAVEVLTDEASARIRDLLNLEVPFDRQRGEIALGLEAAHRARRVLHAGGDATGFHIEQALCQAIRRAGVAVNEVCFVTDIVIEDGRAAGVRTLSNPKGGRACGVVENRGSHVVLASGGAGRLFSHTTNPSVATGDGLALAYRAGAELTDLEFYQFHPTALAVDGFPSFLISEAVRGEGAYLRNVEGERFMLRVDPRGELAPRDVVARAIAAEMQRTGAKHVLLDLTHLPADLVARRFPSISAYCLKAGLNVSEQPLPVAPAAHYFMGGVRTNLWGETTVPGLYACGEVACTGVHGANRLASNSLLEGLVFGARTVQRTISHELSAAPIDSSAVHVIEQPTFQSTTGRGELPTLPAVQELMWNNVGLSRNHEDLQAAVARLTEWESNLPMPATAPDHELANLLLIGRLMASAAIMRTESRGSHYRSDFQEANPIWLRHIVLSKGNTRYAFSTAIGGTRLK